ncbi:MAG: hypothetical protein ACYC69_05460 [Thermodesulfovibrionales bacterium]
MMAFKRKLFKNIITLVVFLIAIIFMPSQFSSWTPSFYKWRTEMAIILTLAALGQIIYDYKYAKAHKLAWVEPKSITRARSTEEIVSLFRQPSWIRIVLFVLPVILGAAYLGQTKLQIAWYVIALAFGLGIICAAIFGFILVGMTHYLKRATVIMDEEGIRLGGNDARLRKFLYRNMSYIELVPHSNGSYSLAWQYLGKEIIRGISQEIETSQIKTLIENNSKLKLIIKDALTSDLTADRD